MGSMYSIFLYDHKQGNGFGHCAYRVGAYLIAMVFSRNLCLMINMNMFSDRCTFVDSYINVSQFLLH